jgi:hypothetical protein
MTALPSACSPRSRDDSRILQVSSGGCDANTAEKRTSSLWPFSSISTLRVLPSQLGGEQRCQSKNWLVDNDGDVYIVDRDTFARIYIKVAQGYYLKTSPVWAERVSAIGSVRTQEGMTHYQTGDYLVSNNPEGKDRYAIASDRFLGTYEPVS